MAVSPPKHKVNDMSDLILKAAEFSMMAHKGQTRKSDGSSYWLHVFGVGSLARHAGGSDVEVAAAFLHDVLEDTGFSREELLANFGPEVVGIVEEVSEDKSLPFAERKALYVAHLRHCSPSAALVACADKQEQVEALYLLALDRGLSGASLRAYLDETFKGGAAATLAFYRDCCMALYRRGDVACFGFGHAVQELEKLAA